MWHHKRIIGSGKICGLAGCGNRDQRVNQRTGLMCCCNMTPFAGFAGAWLLSVRGAGRHARAKNAVMISTCLCAMQSKKGPTAGWSKTPKRGPYDGAEF